MRTISGSMKLGLLVILMAALPLPAHACCLWNPFDTCGMCGPRPWCGLSMGLTIPFPCCGGCGPCAPRPMCGPPIPPPNLCGPALPPPTPCGCGPTLPPTIGPALPAPIPSACDCIAPPMCATAVPMTTFRSVPTTQVRRESYIENVPVTTYQQITVPRTVYQPQVRYRDVAYTVNQQVAETRSHYLPQVGMAPCSTCETQLGYGMAPHFGASSYAPALSAYPGAISTAPSLSANVGPVPTPIPLPQTTTLPSSPAATLESPQPYAESAWQAVPQRQAQQETEIQQMGGFYPSYGAPARPARSMFQPAPSAATVWQSRWLR